MVTTTIQISRGLLSELKGRKIYEKETYEELIWDLLEDTAELSEETKREIRQAEEEYKKGKIHTLQEVKKGLRL